MTSFFDKTRKAWAAAATIFGAGYAEAMDGGVTADELTAIVVASVVAWVVTWAVPNKPPA